MTLFVAYRLIISLIMIQSIKGLEIEDTLFSNTPESLCSQQKNAYAAALDDPSRDVCPPLEKAWACIKKNTNETMIATYEKELKKFCDLSENDIAMLPEAKMRSRATRIKKCEFCSTSSLLPSAILTAAAVLVNLACTRRTK